MAQKFVELSNTTAGSRMAGCDFARIQLSDGTDVWIEYDPSVGVYYLKYSPDHQTVNALSTLGGISTATLSNTLQNVALARDAADNLYVLGISSANGSALVVQALAKTSGSYAWTAGAQLQAQITSSSAFNSVACQWANTGGGTSGLGHLVMVQAQSDPSNAVAPWLTACDAGALLQGTYTQTGAVSLDNMAGASSLALAADGFGATELIVVGAGIDATGGNLASVQAITVSNTGALSRSYVGNIPGTASNVSKVALVRYAAGQWLAVLPSTAISGSYTAWPITPTTLGSGVEAGTPANLPLNAAGNAWDAFLDPSGAGVWLAAMGAASGSDSTMYRLVWTPSGASGSWASSVVTDDTLTNAYASPLAMRVVKTPVVTAVAWDVSLQVSSTDYALDGDFTVYGTAPNAPTLLVPGNASYANVASGLTFTAQYNSTDGEAQNAYAMRIKTSGASSYSYWNASTSALQSTIVWNSVSTAPGADFSASLPATVISNNNVYNWSMASQESLQDLQGPFASDFTFSAQAGPTLSVYAPTGVVTDTAQPVVQWTAQAASGSSLTAYRVVVYTAAQVAASGFVAGGTPNVWDSGTINGYATQLQVGVSLSNNTAYYAYVEVTETGSISSWASSGFSCAFDVPATPSITASTGTDPATGCPRVVLSVQGHDNLLSYNQASFEDGTTTGWNAGTDTTISATEAEAEDGNWSMLLTPTTAATISASTPIGTGGIAIEEGVTYTAMASFRASADSRSCFVTLAWYDQNGTYISDVSSSTVTDVTTAWTQALLTAGAPSNAVYATVTVTVESTSATSDTHYVDEVGLFPGTVSTWTAGGFVGSTSVQIVRSDGQQVRYASISNPARIPSPSEQVTLYDYEVPPGTAYTYTATVIEPSTGLASAPATSGPVTLATTEWWEFDPTDYSTAVAAQPTQWNPLNTEQSTAHPVMGQTTMNVIANTMMRQDFGATFELFDSPTYEALQDLLISQKTIFISSPWGTTDTGWFRIGPQSGGMSTGMGNQTKNTQLLPSVASGAHRTVAINAIAQPRPTV